MADLSDLDNAALQQTVDDAYAAFGHLAESLDADRALAEAIHELLRAPEPVNGFLSLLNGRPQVGHQVLMSSLSALVNVHSLVTVRNEMSRRAAGN